MGILEIWELFRLISTSKMTLKLNMKLTELSSCARENEMKKMK
jgi:hypothetical protein